MQKTCQIAMTEKKNGGSDPSGDSSAQEELPGFQNRGALLVCVKSYPKSASIALVREVSFIAPVLELRREPSELMKQVAGMLRTL